MSTATNDALRPTRLDDFDGQPAVSRELAVILGAANRREELPPHLLFSGPPGLGKTTLAGIVATETGLPLVAASGPLLEKPAELVSLLVSQTKPCVLFIDEIHRMPMQVEETLYTAMEDGRIDVVIADGGPTGQARTIPMPLEPFCLIGATTRVGSLSGPFRDRFGHIAKLHPYDSETLARIIGRSARLLGDDITDEAAQMIADRSRGTPRIANHLLKRVRDYIHSHDLPGPFSPNHVEAALELFGVDALGLNSSDRELLTALCQQFNGGPVGVGTLAAAVGETPNTLEEVNEPFLMRAGMLMRTKQGRVATAKAWQHLGITAPDHAPVAASTQELLPLDEPDDET